LPSQEMEGRGWRREDGEGLGALSPTKVWSTHQSVGCHSLEDNDYKGNTSWTEFTEGRGDSPPSCTREPVTIACAYRSGPPWSHGVPSLDGPPLPSPWPAPPVSPVSPMSVVSRGERRAILSPKTWLNIY
jgi:hypothetical protein